MAISEMSWRLRGACNGLEASIFYPSDDDDDPLETNALEAKEVCASCRVRVSCLEHALASHERDGVWGGATERERRKIIRQRRRTA